VKSDRAAEVVVIGAGAAGLFAAVRAAERGKRVLVLEKNTKPGVKILMSGGTRCNLTQATDRRALGDAFPRDQSRFLRSPLAALGPEELVDMFHREGLRTKVESTGKVFPTSDRALDVQRTLLTMLQRSGAKLELSSPVFTIDRSDDGFVVDTPAGAIHASQVIIATGGQSYPGCGTTGDGYAWAKSLGHSIVPPRPALVPLKTKNEWTHELSGLTLPDIRVSIVSPDEKKPLASDRGSVLFTHVGLSGPVVLDVSREVTARPRAAGLVAECDFLPDVRREQLVEQLQLLNGRRQVRGLVEAWLPNRLVESLFHESNIPLERTAAELSKAERLRLVESLKATRLELTGTLGFAKAEVTAGGVALDEVNSSNLESKCSPGLFLVGEVLDIDGPIGGYNFQAAFSTGWLAGESV
jgi:predicted Rossmann fold flavoprotein